FLQENPLSSSSEIHKGIGRGSYATIKRVLTSLLENGQIISEGQRRATRYRVSPTNQLLGHIDMDAYFEKEIDECDIHKVIYYQLLREVLTDVIILTEGEASNLQQLQDEIRRNVADMSHDVYNKEIDRLTIDLSWKSSQIAGHTNSLHE